MGSKHDNCGQEYNRPPDPRAEACCHDHAENEHRGVVSDQGLYEEHHRQRREQTLESLSASLPISIRNPHRKNWLTGFVPQEQGLGSLEEMRSFMSRSTLGPWLAKGRL